MNALTVKIRSCVKLEQITDLKMKHLREAHLPLTNNEAIQNMLKGHIIYFVLPVINFHFSLKLY